MLPVEVPLSGKLPDGVSVERVEVNPRELRVGGPESHVMNATRLVADPFDLTQFTVGAERTVAVYSSDPEVRLLSTPQVKVRLRVQTGPVPRRKR
jgi:YbbR domain-containing protein